MTQCTYARKIDSGFEYGIFQVKEGGTKNEKREYISRGVAPTMDEALRNNSMALNGLPRIGQYVEPVYAKDR